MLFMTFCASEPREYVQYDASPSLTVCGGTRQHLEEFVPFLAEELGLSVAGDTFKYAWLDEEEYVRSGCPEATAGCQKEGLVMSRRPALIHELIHAVTDANEMNRLPFFTEGIAVAYDPFNGAAAGPRFRFHPPEGEETRDPRDLMVGALDAGAYDTAGGFVTFLLLRHGPEKFVAMTRLLAAESDLDEVRAGFARAYGVDLDDEASLFMSNGPCDDIEFDVRTYDCAMVEVPWQGPEWSWSASMDCDDERVVGGIDPGMSSNFVQSAVLEVPTTGRYAVTTVGSGDTQVTIGRCFGCPWAPRDHVVAGGGSLAAELSAGRHFVRLTSSSAVTPAVQVTLVAAK